VHVASLLKLVIPLGFSANAIRLGLSRMSKQGVFSIRRAGRCSYYSLSEKGMKWMEQGRVRAFEVEHKQWNGKWRLVVYNIPERLRVLRDKLRGKLHSLGFAKLSTSLWVAPHDLRTEIDQYIKDRGMIGYVETFVADYSGYKHPREFAALVWNTKDLEGKYGVFMRNHTGLYSACKKAEKRGKELDLAECFARRFCMTAEYVALRLEDPMLPMELLPENWKGVRAQKLHDTLLKMLKPRADEFVDSVLAE
jgi:phenylacetic acid degradation operon negative regulatory protein